ncbi:hypothetical protein ACFOW1_04275 [Parasediminibacterium paludis]|uniref:Uncharacterized protein n=1 Tax=Parasediminibacterium paludis TaxID=908966 RepID=A0ABV8PSS9_9BACT
MRRQRGMKARREKVGRRKQMLDDRWQREGIEAGRQGGRSKQMLDDR